MKTYELDWTPYKNYYVNDMIFTVDREGQGLLVRDGTYITDMYNLKYISNLEFEEYVDWSTIPKDTPVLINSNSHLLFEDNKWVERLFSRKTKDMMFVYQEGQSSKMTKDDCTNIMVSYDNIKLLK